MRLKNWVHWIQIKVRVTDCSIQHDRCNYILYTKVVWRENPKNSNYKEFFPLSFASLWNDRGSKLTVIIIS